jgi:hypothetical protein
MSAFAPEQVEQMRARLNELHAEFMRESDPQMWPNVNGESPKEQRYYRKLHCTSLLKLLGELQRILERIPEPAGRTAGDSTAQHVAEARALGAALRQRLKDDLQ